MKTAVERDKALIAAHKAVTWGNTNIKIEDYKHILDNGDDKAKRRVFLTLSVKIRWMSISKIFSPMISFPVGSSPWIILSTVLGLKSAAKFGASSTVEFTSILADSTGSS